MSSQQLLKRLQALGHVRQQEPLGRHVTFGVGGPADIYFVAQTRDQLREAFVAAADEDTACFILGAGSNILVGDDGIRGLVIENESNAVEGPQPAEDDSLGIVDADSGVSFAAMSRRLCRSGWGGTEWAVGIPGSLGGAVVHNAGAHDGWLSHVLLDASICGREGQVEQWPNERLTFSYRNSVFTSGAVEDRVVLGVRLMMRREDPVRLMKKVAEYDRHRTAAQPPGRNCGSVFKNPEGYSSWELLDRAGLRGTRIGNAQISEKHSNFILNLGGARAGEVNALIDLATERVHTTSGVTLETEVNLVGEGFDV